ncbi:hypothetical protein BCR32DRAFT_266011 [Anaeromyces robustus]|uniref:SURF4-domain-containing protein n=1 Tax=Anaeromyces robustus TaxID=1754192 RepID=A0A1Y1XGT2_9FUNG|nr:hypothetical protein BCR32DRAFT_266011 [Anaeromyces robustus]|eukprot:ORX84968.1 hypothetical protein BCR32DRAFT_266011 [Anaeromyces robustus]
MDKNKDRSPSNSIKEIFNYFEYYIVDNNTVSYFPLWGRILLIIPYIEDSISIILKWNEHINYYDKNNNNSLIKVFLLINLIGLLGGSIATFHKNTIKFGVICLIGIDIIQLFLFKQLFNISFYFKLLCVLSGLLLLLSESLLIQSSEINKILLFEQPKILKNIDINIQKNLSILEKCIIVLYLLSIFLANKFNIFVVIAAGFVTIALGIIIFGANNVNSISYFIFILSILNLAINNYWTFNDTMYFTKFQINQVLTILSGITLFICNKKTK